MNVTPDSFSDGGELKSTSAIAERALRLVEEGADALDIGGESTRPGAQRVDADEQIRRTAPAIEAIRAAGITLPITIDTSRSAVARAALDAGADAVNDVSAGTDDADMLSLVAERRCAVILMHRLTTPDRDVYSTEYREEPAYADGVERSVARALRERVAHAGEEGVDHDSILVDPGLGFGKSIAQNGRLLRRIDSFQELGAGVLVGASRKSFLDPNSRTLPHERDPASVAAAAVALCRGARCFRVHDVRTHRLALDALDALLSADPPPG